MKCEICQQAPGFGGLRNLCRDCDEIAARLDIEFERGGTQAVISTALLMIEARCLFLRDDLPDFAWKSVSGEDPARVLQRTFTDTRRATNRQMWLLRVVRRYVEKTRRVPA
jgi:hypothetical protein